MAETLFLGIVLMVVLGCFIATQLSRMSSERSYRRQIAALEELDEARLIESAAKDKHIAALKDLCGVKDRLVAAQKSRIDAQEGMIGSYRMLLGETALDLVERH